MKTKVVEVWCALVMSAVLAGCADTDYDWDSVRSENSQYNYAYNFEQIFGAIDLDQSWDFSSLSSAMETRGDGDVTIKSTNGLDFGVTNSINGSSISTDRSKNNTVYTSINNNTFTVGNATQGLSTPSSTFVIYPVATKTTQTYTMYAKVGNNQPVPVFSKDWTKNPSNNDGSVAYCNKMGVAISSESEKIANWVNEGTVYTIENVNDKGKYFNGSEYIGDSQTFIVVEKDGQRYLMEVEWNNQKRVATKGFIKMDYNQRSFLGIKSYWPDTNYSDLSNASPIISSMGESSTILIGNWYIWSHPIWYLIGTSYTLGIKRSPASNDSYKWNWKANTSIDKTIKDGINNLLTVSSAHISKWANMPALSITANEGDMLEIYVEVDGSTQKFSTSNGSIKYLSGISNPQEMYDENGNLLPDLNVQYFGVDLDGNGTYNDLIFAMIGNRIPQFQPISKRYMVEDMGFAMPGSQAVEKGYTDIDFNDIVVDFETTMNSNHQIVTTAIIRALGGTWDFVLSLKNSDNSLTPIFWKRESRTTAKTVSKVSIPAVVPNTKYPLWGNNFDKFNVGTMYNTGRSSQNNGDNHYVLEPGKKTVNGQLVNQANWDESWLCKIENVLGWDYDTNNLVFTLIDSEADDLGFSDLFNSETDVNNVYFKSDYQFAFPAIGAVPKIVAFDTNKEWRQERVHVNKEWFERTTMSTANIPYDYDYSSGSSDD